MRAALMLVGSVLIISCGTGTVDDPTGDREASSVWSKAAGESCTFDMQCIGSQDRADFTRGLVGQILENDSVVCRPASGKAGAPDLRCQVRGDLSDHCFQDSDCVDGLECRGAVNNFFDSWDNPTKRAGLCAMAPSCNANTCPAGHCVDDVCYPN
jgi:hypothetical protein